MTLQAVVERQLKVVLCPLYHEIMALTSFSLMKAFVSLLRAYSFLSEDVEVPELKNIFTEKYTVKQESREKNNNA